MPTIQDMPLEIQSMIMKHLNAPSIYGKWIAWKLYKNDDIVNAVFPFFHLVRNNVVLSCRETFHGGFNEEFLKIVGPPWIVTNSPQQIPYNDSPDDY